MVVIIALLVFILISGFVRKQKEAAYLQGLNDANIPTETVTINDEIKLEAAMLEKIVAPASKLTTYEYYYTNVGIYEKSDKLFSTNIKLPFTTDKTIYTYSGRVGVGVDIKDVTFDVDNDEKSIVIHYPDIKILSHEMEKGFEFYNLKGAVFNKSDFNDYEEFRSGLKTNVEDDLKKNDEFMDSAKQNTELVVSSFLTASGKIDDYTITHEW